MYTKQGGALLDLGFVIDLYVCVSSKDNSEDEKPMGFLSRESNACELRRKT